MSKINPISGFPEWLPAQRIIEQRVLDDLRARFESYGYASIETRAVEPLERLQAKGETDKEIYVLRRLQAAEGGSDSGLGLHFDLTVPFARYVAQNRGQLAYPFKRYQIQKVWRGERPQRGRYREFLQADLDVVDTDTLSLHFDAEMPRLLWETVSAMPVDPVTIGINNRKVLQGAYECLGVGDITAALRTVDKLQKIGADKVRKALTDEVGLAESAADTCLALGRIKTTDASFADAVRGLGLSGDLLDDGLSELTYVADALSDLPAGAVEFDLSIARGFDYYTGTVYEGVMPTQADLGTVCSGGRYDDLVGGGKVKLPGNGVSIGVTRMLATVLGKGGLAASRPVPTCVLVILNDEDSRRSARAVAQSLRARGIATEVFHEPVKFGKQIKYAQKRCIPYVWFVDGDTHEVKDLGAGEQAAADPATWSPAPEHLRPQV